ncbi:DUF4097 family beta strand repeat-containing protein [Knoellia sp. p5-6-4]|uniref:DUF4097 family beta strand repeat-containing protein n=1 Tax=unclassified Knoellia TaxID=2618719 RepID=UPI0023DA0546|nr:DUF4097 family beta strand repeat-containing protein [Knoellia sp. p5-6-4]MDF2143705.1 DUF4097 family beta strand repeat-containing protein [Knoellia sp. p5-6-4]
MPEKWSVEGPRVLDIGGDGEQVRALKVGIVGGRVDVVTHDDSPTARVEVLEVVGQPVLVRWDGSMLRITHGPDSDLGVVDRVRQTVEGIDHNRVVVSVSIPQEATATVSTVSADALVAGVRAAVRTNTVSGSLTLDDLTGAASVNTVSGAVECSRLKGPLSVNSVSGSVTAQRSDLPDVSIHTVSGDVALDMLNGTASISSTSVSGDVTVRSPIGGYDVRATSPGGQVVVDGRELRHGPYAAGGQLTDGDGALRLRANAVTGNVVVLRAARGPATGGSGLGEFGTTGEQAV